MLTNMKMMSDGRQYWGHQTCNTDSNNQLNARRVLAVEEAGREGRTQKG